MHCGVLAGRPYLFRTYTAENVRQNALCVALSCETTPLYQRRDQSTECETKFRFQRHRRVFGLFTVAEIYRCRDCALEKQ